MGAKFSSGDDEPIADINVVPLVDIILVVLIIFMVTAPMVMKNTIDVNLPQAATGKQQTPGQSLDVAIGKGGAFYLDGKEIQKEDLQNQAREAAKKNVNSSAVLTADKTVTLATLTEVIDTLKSAGIKKVGFSIQKK